MQTFLPYPDFNKSLECLDFRRLGKQRVEAKQILNALGHYIHDPIEVEKNQRWRKHPATKMWDGYEPALMQYMNIAIVKWINRGYVNNMSLVKIDQEIVMPPWFGDKRFHSSHRSNLLNKKYDFYKQYDWPEPISLPYFWPV